MISLGQALREQREARNISLEEIAASTKIVPRYLEALEADRLKAMPGGFFIKGIIRSYAKAVGLDPEEVLARYRAAGLLSEPEHVRTSLLRRAGRPEPGNAPATLDLFPAEPSLPGAEEAGSPLVIEAARRRRLSPAARKRIFAVAWRLAAILAAVAVLIVLWSNRTPRRPESPSASLPAQIILPPPQTSGPAPAAETAGAQAGPQAAPGVAAPGSNAAVPVPSAQPAAEPSAKPAAPPVSEDAWKGVTVEITFEAETWIHVQTDGEPKIDGIFPAGATATARADRVLLIHTGNAGGFTFRLNGRPARRLGRSGQVLTDVKITPENIKDFLEAPSPGSTAG
ncbi:MAG: RodZ domain-containing protein [Acidobacteriota bacterium]